MRIKELREYQNLTQLDIANAIQTSQSNIGRWENGKNEPSSSQLIKLANFFSVSIDYLVGREDDFGNVAVGEPALTENEKRLLKAFNSLSDVAQRKLIDDAEFYAGNVTQAIPKAIKK